MNILLNFSAIVILSTLFPGSQKLFSQQKTEIASNNEMKNNLDQVVDRAAKGYLTIDNTHAVAIGIYYKGQKHLYNYNKDSLTDAYGNYNIGSVAKTCVTTIFAKAAP